MYRLIFALLLVLAVGCNKAPMSPTFDNGGAGAHYNTTNTGSTNTNTSQSTLNMGDGPGNIVFSASIANEKITYKNISFCKTGGSPVTIATDADGSAGLAGVSAGVYTATLASGSHFSQPSTKNVTITNGTTVTVIWADNKTITITPQDFVYSGYSASTGCTESTTNAGYNDPRYLNYGNLSEVRKFNIDYSDTGDFQAPLTFSNITDNGCTANVALNSEGHYAVITYNIPANNTNNASSLSINCISANKTFNSSSYSFNKGWSLIQSGGNILKAGRINISGLNARLSIDSGSYYHSYPTQPPSGPPVTTWITEYWGHTVQYLSGDRANISNSDFSSNTYSIAGALINHGAVNAANKVYLNDNSSHEGIVSYRVLSPASVSLSQRDYTQSYTISVFMNDTLIGSSNGSFTANSWK